MTISLFKINKYYMSMEALKKYYDNFYSNLDDNYHKFLAYIFYSFFYKLSIFP